MSLPKGVKRALDIVPGNAHLQRKARKQIEGAAPAKRTQAEGAVYNIWYHAWAGGNYHSRNIEHAKTRCDPKRDSGVTRNLHPTTFCLHFAKGACNKGFECGYLHRVPSVEDPVDNTADCFGRDRFRDSKSDMGGIGGFDRECRTLYVGKIQCSANDIEVIVHKHFAEFGTIQRIRCLHDKKVAFVTYVSRSNAEFAKEAMMEQSLDDEEILNVRWASDDPAWYAKRAIYENAVDTFTERAKQLYPAELSHEIKGGELQDDDVERENGVPLLQRKPSEEVDSAAKGLLNASSISMIKEKQSNNGSIAKIQKENGKVALAGLADYTSDSD